MKDLFEIACGTTAGKDHRFCGKNNHDAVFYQMTEDYFVGVVCDGCGSSKHSEVGAKIGVRFMVQSIIRQIPQLSKHGKDRETTPVSLWERVRHDVLSEISILAKKMGNSFSQVVTDYFLFTTVGVLITPVDAHFFSLGDGVIIINGEIIQVGPFSDNAPPYISYGLVDSSLGSSDPELLKFKIQRIMGIGQLNSFMIGSDGAVDIGKVADRHLPGKTEPVGPVSQFWENDRFFTNPDNINRRLRLINGEHIKPDWETRRVFTESGLLADDTTILVGRRKQQIEGEE